MIDRALYVQIAADQRVNDLALWLEPGASLEEMSAAIHGSSREGMLEITSPGELRQISLSVFDRTFAITYALESVAILIGLVGFSSVGALILTPRLTVFALSLLALTTLTSWWSARHALGADVVRAVKHDW